MRNDWVADVEDIYEKWGFTVDHLNPKELRELLAFRFRHLEEEMDEIEEAIWVKKDPEEIVDGLIDLSVIAIGTLLLFGIDAHKAWDEVHRCNLLKVPGIKENRPQSGLFPDVVKPPGWKGPNHEGNHGLIKRVYDHER